MAWNRVDELVAATEALQLHELPVSRDVDYLCGQRAGVRKLRETVAERSLGAIARGPLQLAREVRTDRDGMRTFIVTADKRPSF